MANESLFEALAKAKAQPSRAFRDTQAALDIPNQAIAGYRTGSELADEIRRRKLQRQTLGELLGANAPTGTGDIPVDQANNLVKPIEAYAALERATRSIPEKPNRFQQGTFLVDGKLTRFDPITGQFELADSPGNVPRGTPNTTIPNKPNAITGTPTITPRVPPTIPTAETDKLADLNSIKEALSIVRENFSPDFVGPLNARVKDVQQTTGFGATGKAALFNQATQDVKDRLLRARSGAQINEQEYQRLTTLVPDQYKSVPDFLAKLNRFDQVLDSTIASKRQELTRAGYRGASGNSAPVSGAQSNSYNSENDVPSNLPKGTIVYINGRKAVIR